MGCNSCKEKKVIKKNNLKKTRGEMSTLAVVLSFLLRIVLFLVSSVLASVIVIPFSVYMLFKVFFVDGQIDVESVIIGIGKIFNRKEEEEIIEEEYEDEEEYEYVNISEVDEMVS